MKPEEIKKALENKLKENKHIYLDIAFLKKLLDLINRYEEIVKKCEKVEHFADKTIATLQAENERLKWERDAYIEIQNTAIAEAKAEAIKEFAERLKEKKHICLPPIGYPIDENDWVIYEDDIDNLLKKWGLNKYAKNINRWKNKHRCIYVPR